MGDRNFLGLPSIFAPNKADEQAREIARVEREEQRLAEQRLAHEMAYRQCPEDIKEFGRRHGVPHFAEMVWLNGFMAGYKQRARDDAQAAGRADEREEQHG